MGPAPADELRMELACDARSVARARGAVTRLAGDTGADPADVGLAVSEAVANCVVHAFRDRAPGSIVLLARTKRGRLTVTVSDDGSGMVPNLESGGLGIGTSLITHLAREVYFDSSQRGTTVTMSFPAGAVPSPGG